MFQAEESLCSETQRKTVYVETGYTREVGRRHGFWSKFILIAMAGHREDLGREFHLFYLYFKFYSTLSATRRTVWMEGGGKRFGGDKPFALVQSERWW